MAGRSNQGYYCHDRALVVEYRGAKGVYRRRNRSMDAGESVMPDGNEKRIEFFFVFRRLVSRSSSIRLEFCCDQTARGGIW